MNRDFPCFTHLHLLSSDLFSSELSRLSDSSLLCFSSVHIVGSLASKLPSINKLYLSTGRCLPSNLEDSAINNGMFTIYQLVMNGFRWPIYRRMNWIPSCEKSGKKNQWETLNSMREFITVFPIEMNFGGKLPFSDKTIYNYKHIYIIYVYLLLFAGISLLNLKNPQTISTSKEF